MDFMPVDWQSGGARAVGVAAVWIVLAHPAVAQESKTLPDATAPALQEEDPPVVNEAGGRLVVTGETVVVSAGPDQLIPNSSIATKIETPLIETPSSISITDRRTLDDLGAINITQAHDHTVGVTPLDERGPAFARGFLLDFYDLRRDGLRTYAWSVREPAAVERIQYLRGPASVLYGDGSPGGVVNLVLKKPLAFARHEVSAAAGGLGFGRATADVTGPVTDNRRIRYRLVAATEWLDDGFDNDERRLSFLPMVSFDLASGTTIQFDTEVYDQRGRGYHHTVPATADTQRGDFSGIPWDLNMASPDDGWRGWNWSPGLRLDTQLGNRASLHVSGRYTKIGGDLDFQALLGLAPDGRTANRAHYREISEWHEYQSDSFVTVTSTTGPLEHRLVVGIESGLSTTDSEIGIGPAPTIDIFEPDYGARHAAPPTAPVRYDVLRLGVYARDQIRLSKHLIAAPALRWSRLHVEDHVGGGGSSSNANSIDTKLSPSLGFVVLPAATVSFYAIYGEGFEPPAPGLYLEDGRAAEPVTNASIEAGMKTIISSRLSVTGAAYRIRQTNVAEFDPRGFYRQVGEGQSHGLELEMVGSVVPRVGIRGGYAWTRSEITQDVSGFVGRELPNAPRHKANLWVRYRIAQLARRPVTLAAGVIRVSDRFTARDNAIVIPGYTRIDASASVELAGPRLVVGLTAQNLTDARYVTSGAGRVFFAGPPRRLAIGLTSAF